MTNDKDLEFLLEEPAGNTESGREERHRRKKGRGGRVLLVLLGCLIVLLGGMWIGARVYMELGKEQAEDDGTVPVNAGAVEEGPDISTMPSYSQEELDAKIAEAVSEAEAEARESAAAEKEAEILGFLQSNLEGGATTVETLRPLYPDKLVLVSNGTFHFVPIREDLAHNDYSQENLRILESGEHQYVQDEQVTSHKGIDVSKHQGKIDWAAVAEDGVEFVFIRVGLRGYGTGEVVEDEYFQANIEGAKAAGIKVGVYFFSQAISPEEALEEANFVLEKIAPYELDCPVVLDVEKVAGANARMNNISVEERTANTVLFCQTIEAAGYRPMVYHNMEAGILLMNLELLENYDKWFAYYQDEFYYPYSYGVWQYSDKGRVNGISTNVDMNICFEPLWE